MSRYYLNCPECRTRMIRTGEKVEENYDINGLPIYRREYKCPGCGRFFIYSEDGNFFTPGRFEEVK